MQRPLLSLLALIIISGPLVGAETKIPPEERLPAFNNPGRTLTELETIIERYYRREQVDGLVDNYNAWVAKASGDLQEKVDALNALSVEITTLETLLQTEDAELKKLQEKAKKQKIDVKKFNKRVDDFNKQAEKREKLIKQHKKDHKALERAQARLERQANFRGGRIDKAFTSYNEWYKQGKDVAFNKKLNQFYAWLRRKEQTNSLNAKETKALITVSKFRQELVDWLKKRGGKEGNGMIYLDATIGNEKCNYILDTGASMVTLDFQMVYALGLENDLGEEITMSLAGGTRLTGYRVTLPSMTVLGKTLKNVEAIAMPDDSVGTHGLLGHSFLDRFHYIIDSSLEQPLILKPLPPSNHKGKD